MQQPKKKPMVPAARALAVPEISTDATVRTSSVSDQRQQRRPGESVQVGWQPSARSCRGEIVSGPFSIEGEPHYQVELNDEGFRGWFHDNLLSSSDPDSGEMRISTTDEDTSEDIDSEDDKRGEGDDTQPRDNKDPETPDGHSDEFSDLMKNGTAQNMFHGNGFAEEGLTEMMQQMHIREPISTSAQSIPLSSEPVRPYIVSPAQQPATTHYNQDPVVCNGAANAKVSSEIAETEEVCVCPANAFHSSSS